MTRVKKGGRDFQKGNPGGPGRPRLTEEEKAVRNMSRDEYRKLLLGFLQMTRPELLTALKNPATPALERVVVRGLCRAMKYGDLGKLEQLLERVIGKVKDELDLNVHKPVVIERPSLGTETVLGTEKDREEIEGRE